MCLKFPEEWVKDSISKHIIELNQKSKKENEFEVLTSSKKGLMRQSDYYGESRLTRRSSIGFNVVPENYLTYRSRSDNNKFTFNHNTLGFTGLISKYYPVFTSKHGEKYNGFLQYLMTHYSDLFSLESVGTSQLVLSMNAVKSVKLPFPPLPEQQKIAAILSSVDTVIETTRAQIDKLKDLKTGMMQELLTKGIGHTEFKDSPVGRIPAAWDISLLESISERISDGIHTTPKYVDKSEYQFINGNNLRDGEITLGDKAKYVSKSEFLKHKKDLTTNTILMSINGTIGNLAFYDNEKVVLGKSAAFISLNNQQSKEYIYFALQSQAVKKFYDLELTGSTINNLSLRTIKSTPIPIPPKDEQLKIKTILASFDETIRKKSFLLTQTDLIKKALMQDLLTGKVRVTLNDKESTVA